MPNIKTLKAFRSVADHGSFYAAAAENDCSISKISLQIQALERFAGIILFDRTHKPPPITEAGKLYLDKVDAVLSAWEELENSGVEVLEGDISIGTVHTALTGMLPQVLKCISTELPNFNLTVIPGYSHFLEEEIIAGRIDFALLSRPEQRSGMLQYCPVLEEELVLIAHESQKGDTPEECLRNNNYLMFDPNTRIGAMIENLLANYAIRSDQSMEIDSLEGMLAMVSHGLGVSIVPMSTTLKLPDGVRILHFDDAPSRQLCLVYPKIGRKISLADTILECFRMDQANGSCLTR